MYIYNITFSIDKSIFNRWLTWAKDLYLPKVEKCGYFETIKLLRVLDHMNDESVSYCCQLEAKSIKDIQMYEIEYGEKLKSELHAHFGDKCLPFQTILELVP